MHPLATAAAEVPCRPEPSRNFPAWIAWRSDTIVDVTSPGSVTVRTDFVFERVPERNERTKCPAPDGIT
jgi:hypothetical protein